MFALIDTPFQTCRMENTFWNLEQRGRCSVNNLKRGLFFTKSYCVASEHLKYSERVIIDNHFMASLELQNRQKSSFSVDSLGPTRVWVNDDRIFICRWVLPLTGYISSVDLQRLLDSMWSVAQIAASAQPISRCETDRLWPHRSSADLYNSRADFYSLKRERFEFTIGPCYLSRPPPPGTTVQIRPRTTCVNWEFPALRSVNYDKCTRDRSWEDY